MSPAFNVCLLRSRNSSTRERDEAEGRQHNQAIAFKCVADWTDHRAWRDFCTTYDPLIQSWCRGYGLDESTQEDLCQEIRIRLVDRMRMYQYDTGRTFRGWLRKFCHSRAIDLLRRRRTEIFAFLADQSADALAVLLAVDATGGEESEEPEEAESRHSLMLRQAEQVQHAVKQRVEPQTWPASGGSPWMAAPCVRLPTKWGCRMRRCSRARKRVGRMLRAEGKRRLVQQYPVGPETIAPDIL